MSTETENYRIDKWLWAARFFKSRSLATDAVEGGKVHVNGQRVKPSREVKVGDELTITQGFYTRTVIVTALSVKRGSAPQAALLYQETAESIEKLKHQQELHKQAAEIRPPSLGRPTKRDRRLIHHFKRGE